MRAASGSALEWRKLGCVFRPDGTRPWMRSHASNPVAEPLDAHRVRVYFGCRDDEQRTSVGFVEIDLREPTKVLRLSEAPVLAPGPPGAFDDSGVSVGCVVDGPDATHLYYVGWNLGVTVPFRNTIGLAVRKPGEECFTRVSPAPVLGRTRVDPYSLSYPWVRREGAVWRMWYGSNPSWGADGRTMTHEIRYAESSDGVDWEPTGRVAIAPAGGDETSVSRPCVVRDADGYRMWYSRRGATYRIGYAESADGLAWTRRDEAAGIDVSPGGWDAESVEYASVFDHAGRRYMVYNGDGYGRTGFGLAVADS